MLTVFKWLLYCPCVWLEHLGQERQLEIPTRKHHSEWQIDELSTKVTDWTEHVERGKQPLLRQLVIEERKHLKFNSHEKL